MNTVSDLNIKKAIEYPYLPEGRTLEYVPITNQHMAAARAYAEENSIDTTMPTGSVLVLNGEIIGRGANGSTYHQENVCVRVAQNIPTGQGYDLCEGCTHKNHSEPRSILDAQERGHETKGADLYLWGHWWCCEPCWNAMIKAGVHRVFLMEGSQIFFNKEEEGNVVGRQFDVSRV